MSFQSEVAGWAIECFGQEVALDIKERNHRFLEESLELVQSLGCTKSEALQLVDYVYDRPVGETFQEIGGVMVTLAALCSAIRINLTGAANVELKRIKQKIEKIREKHNRKPQFSPLPGSTE